MPENYIDLVQDTINKKGYFICDFKGKSMLPTLKEGINLHVQKISLDDIRVGNIVLYKRRHDMVAHRVIKIKNIGKDKLFLTKGDNQAYIEPEKIEGKDILGIVNKAFHRNNMENILNTGFVDIYYVIIGNIFMLCKLIFRNIPNCIKKPFKGTADFCFNSIKNSAHLFKIGKDND